MIILEMLKLKMLNSTNRTHIYVSKLKEKNKL